MLSETDKNSYSEIYFLLKGENFKVNNLTHILNIYNYFYIRIKIHRKIYEQK